MINPKNLNKCCPSNDGNVGKAIHSLSNRIQYLERTNSNIENSLDEEKSRAIDAENTLQQHIEEEQNRAITKEEEILSDLTDEIAARKQAINNVISSIPEAQILSDWNLSDSNAKDYIKNKPHALDGKSAYELAVDNGFEGTEQEWFTSLTGPQGPKGDPFIYEDFTADQLEALRGPQGIQGEQGPAGQDGSDGIDGKDGAPGLDGHTPVITASKSGGVTTIFVDGTAIAAVNDGLDGQNGQDGQDGSNGVDGVTPHIDSTTKHWMIGTTDTGIVAEGQDGSDATVDTSEFLQVPITANGHAYVEIGGLKWATMNIGATSVTDGGQYFQWGDTQGYTADQVGSGSGQKYFEWADYKYGNGTSSPDATGITKYNYTDGKTVLDISDDAARANWGGGWRMPTTAEFQALSDAVNTVWTESYQGSGVAGLVCTDKNDSSKVLFFPAAGFCYNGSAWGDGIVSYCWSSSRRSNNVLNAYHVTSHSVSTNWDLNNVRYYGLPVRPVLDLCSNQAAKVAITGSYDDLLDKPTIPTIWRGTQVQYDAITTPDDNTIYIITSVS